MYPEICMKEKELRETKRQAKQIISMISFALRLVAEAFDRFLLICLQSFQNKLTTARQMLATRQSGVNQGLLEKLQASCNL